MAETTGARIDRWDNGRLCAPLSRAFHRSDQGIILHLPYFRRELSWSDIERGSARVLSLKANPSFRFTAQVGAVGAPGYQVGWYTTEGEGDVLAAVNSDEVVSWRTSRGYTVLVSAEDAEALAHAIAG